MSANNTPDSDNEEQTDDNSAERKPGRRQPIAAFAILTHDLFANRKVRRAGAFGALVFVFALLRNAARGRKGFFPAADIEPWYLGDQLQIGEDEARKGLERAIAAGLLAIEGDTAVICGWDESWARHSISESESRQLRRLRGLGAEPESNPEKKTKKSEREKTQTRSEKRSPDSARTKSGHGVFGPLSPAISQEERADAEQIVGALHAYTGASYHLVEELEAVVSLRRKGHSAKNLVLLAQYTADDNGLGWMNKTDRDGRPYMRGNLNPTTVFSENHVGKYLTNAISPAAWTPAPDWLDHTDKPRVMPAWGDHTGGNS